MKFQVSKEDPAKRLDIFLAGKIKDLTRSHIQKIIDEGLVLVNGKPAKSSYKIRTGDEIELEIPAPKKLDVQPENIPMDVLYEDKDLLVINKPKGMVVHPAVGNFTGTMVNALLYQCKDLSGIGGVLRPGIVHRLDKDTTGVLVVAKNDLAHVNLSKQIKDRSVKRSYLALVHGDVKESGKIETLFGRHAVNRKKMAVRSEGKVAITHYKIKERFGKYTLLEVEIKTGRTHQIRVHLAHIKHPIVGDTVYGRHKEEFKTRGQVLHAQLLGFAHPRTGEYMEFKAPPPKEMQEIIKSLRYNKSQCS